MLKVTHFRRLLRRIRRSPASSDYASSEYDSDDENPYPDPLAPRLTTYLPQELMEYVIDFLYNDKPTLRACSLVCRAWVAEARVHLFRSIHIQTMKQSGIAPPELTLPLVRKLTWGPRRAPFTDSRRWCASLDALAPRLSHLQSLTLVKIIVPNSDARQFILLGMEVPSVTRLKVVDCDFVSLPAFVAFLHAFPHLAHLELREVENWAEVGQAELPTHDSKGVELQSLSCALLNSWPFIDWLVRTASPHSLRKIAFSIMQPAISRNAQALAALLLACGDSLDQLMIDSGVKVDLSVSCG
jgi:hypothetical protein